MRFHFRSDDGWEDFCSSEEEHWELTKLYTMAGTPYTVELIEEEAEETMEGKYDSLLDSHPSLSAQERNQFLQ